MIRRMNINQSVKITNDHFCIFSDSSLISVDPWRLTQAEIRLNHHRLSPPTLHSFIHSRWIHLAAQFFRSSRRRRSDQTVSVQAISHRTNQHWQDRSGCSSSSSLQSTTFLKKKQLDLISLRCSLSCWAVNHTLMSPVEQTDLTDTCFTAAQVWIPLHPSLMLQRHLSPVWKTRTDSPCRPEAQERCYKHLTWRLQRPLTKQQISRNDGEEIWRF